MKWSLADLQKKAYEELSSGQVFEKYFENVIVPELTDDKVKGFSCESTMFAEMFCIWAREQNLPVYHVAEECITASKTFSALFELERWR